MFYRPIREVMQAGKSLTLSRDTTVRAAAALMAKAKLGAAMVVDAGRLVGIFTERDALFRVIANGLDPDTTPMFAVMTAEPRTVSPEDTFGYALVMMQEGGFRHAPVVEDGRPIGIVSSRSVMDPELEEFISEANRREQFYKRR
jgi:CBS domain-containing protein